MTAAPACPALKYLNFECMQAIDPRTFRDRRPFPWVNVQGLVNDDAFGRLCGNLPNINVFEKQTQGETNYGDRYALQYRPGLSVPEPWREFIAELEGPEYQKFIRRLFGLGPLQKIELTMHWHFAPRGFWLAPHVDARRKMGSHIFYLNSAADWDPRWGGQTLVLDDAGRFAHKSRPDFKDLREAAASEILGNQSFIFQRNEHSWHGVRPLECPPDKLRKVFIIVINQINLQVLWRRIRGKDADGYRLKIG